MRKPQVKVSLQFIASTWSESSKLSLYFIQWKAALRKKRKMNLRLHFQHWKGREKREIEVRISYLSSAQYVNYLPVAYMISVVVFLCDALFHLRNCRNGMHSKSLVEKPKRMLIFSLCVVIGASPNNKFSRWIADFISATEESAKGNQLQTELTALYRDLPSGWQVNTQSVIPFVF
ncbi:hypothetical protein SAY87_005044 [Trapa incisa]|uniref:Uncharacterized protein n=1 Tax=Trapa incisa TaxID=236973 RepID=A0AAN7PM57_9MYRT|nr:hypothetical protein SAY87_005044 [Trapa incisa]